MIWWILGLAGIALIAAVVNGFLAPLHVHYRASNAAPLASNPDDAPFVGLALSGGGARAAVFAAAGMQALHARGLLADVNHVSSVSGGGFPASYLALHPVPADGDAGRYFACMQDVVAHDYFWDVQITQLRKPLRAFSPSRRLLSLQEALNRPDFLKSATFSQIDSQRRFFFNAVSYDSGQRFAMSNAGLPAPAAKDDTPLPGRLRSLSFSDPDAMRRTPDDFPVALAVATSAAFPPYLGPMTIEVPGRPSQYWHLGDGGVFENPGVETLREAVYARGPNQTATIYSFNAGQQLDPNLSRNTLDISIWSRDVTRLVDVLTEYATSHRETNYQTLDDKNGMKIEHIDFNYMDVVRLANSDNPPDPRWLSWDGWQHATDADRRASATPADHLAKIPTALKITPCNRELIAAAAIFLVEQRFPMKDRG